MSFKRKIALYFLTYGKLTEIENEDARAISHKHNVDIRFRNGDVEGVGAPETADFVAGPSIPKAYENYVRITADAVYEPATDKTGDPPAPTPAETLTGLAAEVGAVGAVSQQNSGGWG